MAERQETMRTVLFITLASLLLIVPPQAQRVYEGQIDGDFNGWEDETIYKLMDGHIIQQSTYHYHYHYAYSPRVIIYKSHGAYKIHVEDDDDEDVEIIVLK
jgi:hypothetical protein